jgi:hypothetical protein
MELIRREACHSGGASMERETAFTLDTSSIKYGPGVSREVGHDMGQWGCAGRWS